MTETAFSRPMRRIPARTSTQPTRIAVVDAEPGADDAAVWARCSAARLRTLLDCTGAVLLRGFGVADAATLRSVLNAVATMPLGYDERTTRRRAVGADVYTSTDHPARQTILPHNENAYASTWPALLLFCCARSAVRGGETPLYDGRRVLAEMDQTTVEELSRREVLHVRNFGTGLGLGVEEAFGVSERCAIERRLGEAGIAFEWLSGGGLRTRWRTRPVLVHPRTGERTFFSHVAFFHQSALPPEVRSDMLALFGPHGLPHNTFFGDGAPIPDATIAAVLAAYHRVETRFAWARGDCLIVDNMLCAHGRRPFEGDRLVLVALADPVHRSEARFA